MLHVSLSLDLLNCSTAERNLFNMIMYNLGWVKHNRVSTMYSRTFLNLGNNVIQNVILFHFMKALRFLNPYASIKAGAQIGNNPFISIC